MFYVQIYLFEIRRDWENKTFWDMDSTVCEWTVVDLQVWVHIDLHFYSHL